MRIAIVSDTHGETTDLEKALDKLRLDRLIHLGDYVADAKKIGEKLSIPYEAVAGNCDGSLDRGKMSLIDGKKIFLTHGNLFDVKTDLTRIYYHALEMGADAVFFGHTHMQYFDMHDGILFLNPGSASRPIYGPGTFALWENGNISFLQVKKT